MAEGRDEKGRKPTVAEEKAEKAQEKLENKQKKYLSAERRLKLAIYLEERTILSQYAARARLAQLEVQFARQKVETLLKRVEAQGAISPQLIEKITGQIASLKRSEEIVGRALAGIEICQEEAEREFATRADNSPEINLHTAQSCVNSADKTLAEVVQNIGILKVDTDYFIRMEVIERDQSFDNIRAQVMAARTTKQTVEAETKALFTQLTELARAARRKDRKTIFAKMDVLEKKVVAGAARTKQAKEDVQKTAKQITKEQAKLSKKSRSSEAEAADTEEPEELEELDDEAALLVEDSKDNRTLEGLQQRLLAQLEIVNAEAQHTQVAANESRALHGKYANIVPTPSSVSVAEEAALRRSAKASHDSHASSTASTGTTQQERENQLLREISRIRASGDRVSEDIFKAVLGKVNFILQETYPSMRREILLDPNFQEGIRYLIATHMVDSNDPKQKSHAQRVQENIKATIFQNPYWSITEDSLAYKGALSNVIPGAENLGLIAHIAEHWASLGSGKGRVLIEEEGNEADNVDVFSPTSAPSLGISRSSIRSENANEPVTGIVNPLFPESRPVTPPVTPPPPPRTGFSSPFADPGEGFATPPLQNASFALPEVIASPLSEPTSMLGTPNLGTFSPASNSPNNSGPLSSPSSGPLSEGSADTSPKASAALTEPEPSARVREFQARFKERMQKEKAPATNLAVAAARAARAGGRNMDSDSDSDSDAEATAKKDPAP